MTDAELSEFIFALVKQISADIYGTLNNPPSEQSATSQPFILDDDTE